ncbi:MAG: hypothetical protein JW751_07860 [Polyangiaceae bacterium]|nr:hypothetical protein [Polyangiaceae bacterium]
MTADGDRMVVCVTSTSADPRLDETFARCAAFAVFTRTGELLSIVENRAREATGAASTQAVTQLRELGAVAVTAAKYGPNAVGVLQRAGIRAYRCPEPVAAREAWRRTVDGELSFE